MMKCGRLSTRTIIDLGLFHFQAAQNKVSEQPFFILSFSRMLRKEKFLHIESTVPVVGQIEALCTAGCDGGGQRLPVF